MKWRVRPLVWRMGACAALTLLTLAGAAAGQPSDPWKPRDIALFDEARKLMNEGQFEWAASMLEESLRIKPGLGKLFQLSVCHENLGRTASAWSGYNEVARAADAVKREAEATEARRRAAAIEPRLSKLRVSVTLPAADGLVVMRVGAGPGGKALVDSASWGRPTPVDPGMYTIHASAPGRTPWSTTVTVGKPGSPVEVTVPALNNELLFGDSPAPWPNPSEQAPPPFSASTDMPSVKPSPSSRSIAPVLLLGGGAAVAIGVGIAATVAWRDRTSDMEQLQGEIRLQNGSCWVGGVRHPRCGDLSDAIGDVSVMRGVAIAGYTVGGLAVGGLIAYLAISPGSTTAPATQSSIRLLPTASSSGGGLIASGRF